MIFKTCVLLTILFHCLKITDNKVDKNFNQKYRFSNNEIIENCKQKPMQKIMSIYQTIMHYFAKIPDVK